jgi:hypothetical protein
MVSFLAMAWLAAAEELLAPVSPVAAEISPSKLVALVGEASFTVGKLVAVFGFFPETSCCIVLVIFLFFMADQKNSAPVAVAATAIPLICPLLAT